MLYGTEDCHLCDEAKQLLTAAGAHFHFVDITIDDVLVDRFGLHIPVLYCQGRYLNWPFSVQDVACCIDVHQCD